MQDDFIRWSKVKINTDQKSERVFYHKQEIWWCRVGKNIGKEIEGKGEEFTRPVLVLKRMYPDMFIGLPLTHTLREDKVNTTFYFDYDLHCVSFAQMRVFDPKRLTNRMGSVSDFVFRKIVNKLINYLKI